MCLPDFDLTHWKSVYSEADLRAVHQVSLTHSPINIIATEQFRTMAARCSDLGPAVPVDVFTFAKGESPTRHATKVGGLPYRPAFAPWPVDSQGRPLTFLAQYSFADSRDHVADLPGDVLLVFARTMRAYLLPKIVFMIDPVEDIDSLVFEWYSSGLRDLVSANDVPELPPPAVTRFHVAKEEPARALVFPTCYGVRHRSVDYVNQKQVVSALRKVVPESLLPENDFSKTCVLYGLSRYTMMKIGGLPVWYSDERKPSFEGRFIGGFSGVLPAHEVPFPWTNQPEPLSMTEPQFEENGLMIGDPGYLNLFLADDGSVRWYLDALH